MTVTTKTTAKRAPRKKSAKKRSGARAAPESVPDEVPRPPPDPQELRRRWQRTRDLISDAVGRDDDHDPRIWERGAYQLWLYLIVELLVVRRDEIGVDELSLISKMLHDQRKLSLDEFKQLRKSEESGNGATGSTKKLPEHFGDLVRQIYGTNFQDDCGATT